MLLVNRILAGLIQDARVYYSVVIDIESKFYHPLVSRVNLKLKYRKDEKLRETLQKLLNTKLEGLKFDNVEDRWTNFRKMMC